MRKILKISPDIVFLVEGDYWYHFLKYAKQAGAKVYVLSAKLSEKTFQRWKKLPYFSNKLFSLVDKFCLQNALYKDRFKKLQISEEKLVVTGNLKLQPLLSEISFSYEKASREKFHILPEVLTVTIGSTHDPEEKLLTAELLPFLKKNQMKLFLAPRHPERAPTLFRFLQELGVEVELFSKGPSFAKNSIILVDKMGVLPLCYKLSNIAIVAGSFHKSLEGHNVLEPALLHTPVIFGPYMSSQKDLKDLVLKQKVAQELSIDQIKSFFTEIYQFPEKLVSMKEATFSLEKTLRNTLDQTWQALF